MKDSIKNIISNSYVIITIMKSPVFYTWSSSDDEDPEDQDKPVRSGKFSLKRKGAAVIYFDEYEDHVDMYCPNCLKYANVKNKLGPRILEKDKPVPEDHDEWVQCHTCGNIYGLHEIAQDSEIKNTVKTLDSPFESNQTEIIGVSKRTSAAGIKAINKRKKERYRPHHKDPEIDALMRIYGDRVNILMDSETN